jgi:hypothetical protein
MPARSLIAAMAVGSLAAAAVASQPAAIVGEWSPEASLCDEVRLVWTADGRHESMSFDDGRWQVAASAPYRREGDAFVHTYQGVTERMRFVDLGNGRARFDNDRNKPPLDKVELVRCPPRG